VPYSSQWGYPWFWYGEGGGGGGGRGAESVIGRWAREGGGEKGGGVCLGGNWLT